jgi:hypothetical protein
MLNWKKMSEIRPELWDVVIISRDNDREDRSKWMIGQFLQSDDKSFFGVVLDIDNEGKDLSIKAEKIDLWCNLFEGGLKLPSDYKKEDLPMYYDAFRKLALSYEHRFILMAKLSITAKRKIYPLDKYFDGIYNRSLSLMYAILTLLDSNNYMAAASVVRLHLDNFLRLYAAWLVDQPHDFANAVISGTPVKKIRDRNGKPMLDGYLVDKASEEYPWIKKVYDKACGFVHFSGTHVFANQEIINREDGVIGTHIRKDDWDNVTDLSRIEVLGVIIEISDCILHYAYGWARTKMQEDDLETIRKNYQE